MDEELTAALLGLYRRPFVLIELTGVEDNGDLNLSVRAGGGVESQEDIADVLTLAMEGLNDNGGDAG